MCSAPLGLVPGAAGATSGGRPAAVQQAPRALGWQGTSPTGVECERMAGVVLVPGVQLLVTEGLVPVHVSDGIQPRNELKGVTT